MTYFHMATCHTIIGAERFHFRVRDGIGWFTLAMVTKQLVLIDALLDSIVMHRFWLSPWPAFMEICLRSFSFGTQLCQLHPNALGVIWSSLTGN